MNNINRPLVKSQAKELIRDKVFSLFIISLIVSVLTSISLSFNVVSDIERRAREIIGGNNAFGSDFYDFGNGNSFDSEDDFYESNPLEDFEFNSVTGDEIIGSADAKTAIPVTGSVLPFVTSISGIVGFVFIPLAVTLCGFYVSFIKRRPDEQFSLGTEIANLFKKSYDSSALKKFVIVILRELFTALWSLLFIIPGITYYYKSYFSYQIMCEYPNLKPTEALKLSEKMVKGNKGELFLLDLSFFWWYCLTAVTFGLASIYVIPYVSTTQALYYENFRLRALADGRINEDDFLSQDELKAKYTGYSQPGNYYNPDFGTQQEQNNYYTYAQPESDSANGVYYYSPKREEAPKPEESASPQEHYYTPSQEEDNNNE